MSKSNLKPWFKPLRWSYIAVNWQGALCYIPFVAYLVLSVVIARHYTSSVGYTIFQVFPQWIAAAIVMEWFAAHKS